MGRSTKLIPEVQETIVKYIRAGAYDWVAAQAVGIRPQTFHNWMKWGRGGSETYLSFFDEVCRARAQARLMAEAEVRKDNPLAWLRYGPGRERPGEPGWTESHEVTGPGGEAVTIRVVYDGSDDKKRERIDSPSPAPALAPGGVHIVERSTEDHSGGSS